MRIKSFEQFTNEDVEYTEEGYENRTILLMQQVYKNPGNPAIKWVEPAHKLPLEFDEDKTDDCSLLFDINETSIAIKFSWTIDVKYGAPGDRDRPQDPDRSTLTDIDVKEVSISTDGSEDAKYTSDSPAEAAWLLLYKLLRHEPDRQTKAKAEKLKTKLNWK